MGGLSCKLGEVAQYRLAEFIGIQRSVLGEDSAQTPLAILFTVWAAIFGNAVRIHYECIAGLNWNSLLHVATLFHVPEPISARNQASKVQLTLLSCEEKGKVVAGVGEAELITRLVVRDGEEGHDEFSLR